MKLDRRQPLGFSASKLLAIHRVIQQYCPCCPPCEYVFFSTLSQIRIEANIETAEYCQAFFVLEKRKSRIYCRSSVT